VCCLFVIAGLVPAIHAFLPRRRRKDVNARDKLGHDDALDTTSKIPPKGLNYVDLSDYCGVAPPP
jgi:hypothetical protein